MSRLSHACFVGWFVATTAGCSEHTVDVGSLAAGTAGTATLSSVGSSGAGGRGAASTPSASSGSTATAQGGASATGIVAGQGTTAAGGDALGQGGNQGVGGHLPEGGAATIGGQIAQGGYLALGGTGGSPGNTALGGASNVTLGGAASGICCDAEPTCAEGEIRIADANACQPERQCRSMTVCCVTIWCASPRPTCNARPTCDAGDLEIQGTCPPDLSCYQRTTCDNTINCRRNAGTCDASNDHNRRYGSRDPLICAAMDELSCPSGARNFNDACGCGCEQPSTCPDEADCNPEPTVQRAIDSLCGETKTCPYSPCVAGTTKSAGDTCNSCTCNTDGTWTCTNNLCKPSCTAGTAVLANDLCNTCNCNSDGTIGTCTKANCALATLGSIRPAIDGCNTCVYTKDGSWACTQLKCPSCTPGSTVAATDGCNSCTCSSDGKWECTAKACTGCAKEVVRLVDGCNTSTCVDNGSGPLWSGPTEMACSTCTPGSIETAGDYCNACACQPNGTWLCTNNICPRCNPDDRGYDSSSKCGDYTCNSYGGWLGGRSKC